MSDFTSVLRATLERDDGLVVALSALQAGTRFQGMTTLEGTSASRAPAGGWTAGWRGRLEKRSRTIRARLGALFARSNEE